jgi:hypothetical protein
VTHLAHIAIGKRIIGYYGFYHVNAQAKFVAARAECAMPPMKATSKLTGNSSWVDWANTGLH